MTFNPRTLGARCDECPWGCQTPVPPKRAVGLGFSGSPSLIVLAETPGETETERGEPLVGQTGQLFQEILEFLHIPLDQIHKTNAALCQPPEDATEVDYARAVECCHPRLRLELSEFAGKTRTVLAYGNWATRAAIGQAKAADWFGPPTQDTSGLGLGFNVVTSPHPAVALPHREPHMGQAVAEFTRRAWRDSQGLLESWDWGRIVTDADGDEAVLAAIEELWQAPHLGIDVETTRAPKGREQHEFESWSKKLYNLGAGSRRLGLSVSIKWYSD